MWHTADGLRVLTAQEWKVFTLGLDLLWSLLDADLQNGTESRLTDVEVFESLSHPQKILILSQVAEALHESAVPAPPDHPYYNAAAQAVIQIMQGMLHDEIEYGESDDNQQALWQVFDWNAMRSWEPKSIKKMKRKDWDSLVRMFEESIVDGDHELAALVMDKSPEQAAAFKQIMGIDSDYYTAIPPEPTEEMLSQAQATLTRLLRS
ncbi:MAG: hypothetical protein JNJ77_14440 [Planctomycetia bacterium]|nr:hypothetical protein [Planctomycetia bacterium]